MNKSGQSEIRSQNIGPKRNNKNWIIVAGVLFAVCITCICLIAFSDIRGGTNATPTTTATIQNIATIVVQTAEMAYTQTAMFITPTLAVTSTNLPTSTQPVIPTPITIPTSTQPVIPTPITIPTSGNFPIPTNTVIFVLPTNPPSGGACSCSGDLYNCTLDYFSSHNQAQACYEHCRSSGYGDIHQLDGNDQDGLACESLP